MANHAKETLVVPIRSFDVLFVSEATIKKSAFRAPLHEVRLKHLLTSFLVSRDGNNIALTIIGDVDFRSA